MLVYGKNILNEIDKSKIKKVYIASSNYIDFLTNNKIKYEFVDKKRLDNLTRYANHQNIVIDILDYEYYTMDDIDSDFIVVLDHIEDPHNLGAIIRTCECAGIKNIIIPRDRAALVNDTVVKVSCGAIEHVKIIMVSNLNNAITNLKKQNYFVYAADMDGKNYLDIDYAEKVVLVIGNEGSGISRLLRENADEIISIPMKGTINSLNASASAAILIYGMLR